MAESLIDAVRKHNIEEARNIIKRGIPVDIQYETHCVDEICYFTALEVAANNGDLEMVQFLLQAGANPNFKNNDGVTALMGAVRDSYHMYDYLIPYIKSHTEVVQLLIQSGANVDIQDRYGYTALMFAARNTQQRCPLITQILIQAGADINVQNENGSTALMLAALYKNLEIVRILLRAGADIDFENEGGLIAHDFGNYEIKNLISKYPVIKENIRTLNALQGDQSTYFFRIPKDLIGLIKNVFENEIF